MTEGTKKTLEGTLMSVLTQLLGVLLIVLIGKAWSRHP